MLQVRVGCRTHTCELTLSSEAGLKLNDFAVFTTFGLASALLLGVDGPLNGFLAIIYVLTTSFRLCFYSTGEWNPIHLRTVAGIKGQEKPGVTYGLLFLFTSLWRLRALLAEPWSGDTVPASSAAVSLWYYLCMGHCFTPVPPNKRSCAKVRAAAFLRSHRKVMQTQPSAQTGFSRTL